MSYTCRCLCGGVTATITGAAVAVRQCWCCQCQQVAAGGPTNNAIFRTEDVEMSGDLTTHSYTAASGNMLTHNFCAACGTPVMAQSSARPHFRTIRLGFLAPGHDLVPRTAIWTDEAPASAHIDPELEQIARQPLPPVAR